MYWTQHGEVILRGDNIWLEHTLWARAGFSCGVFPGAERAAQGWMTEEMGVVPPCLDLFPLWGSLPGVCLLPHHWEKKKKKKKKKRYFSKSWNHSISGAGRVLKDYRSIGWLGWKGPERPQNCGTMGWLGWKGSQRSQTHRVVGLEGFLKIMKV